MIEYFKENTRFYRCFSNVLTVTNVLHERFTEFMVINLQKIEKRTCIRFKPRTEAFDIEIVNKFGCYSSLGKIGKTVFNLFTELCLRKNILRWKASYFDEPDCLHLL